MGKKKQDKAEPKAETGELVVPEHGKGKIWQGAPANPVAGPGRPPSRIKAALRKSFDERIPALQEIADDADGEIRDRLKALDMMAKYSDLDLNVDIELVEKLGAVVAAEIQDEEAMQRIKEQWLEIVASRIALG